MRISIDNTSILNDLSTFDISWDASMDLIHTSIISKLDNSVHLHEFICDRLHSKSNVIKCKVLWILSIFSSEVMLHLPLLDEDLQWSVVREYDLVLQTWLVAVPKVLNKDSEEIYLARYERYLRQENIDGHQVSKETFKHLEDYKSLMGVYNGNRKSFYSSRGR